MSEPLGVFFYYATRIQIEVIAGRDDVAIALAARAEALSWCVRSYSDFTEYRFYTALAHAGAYHASRPRNASGASATSANTTAS
ncbi:hypothetical protein ACQ5SK_25175 [Bradyrhizobium japonicum]